MIEVRRRSFLFGLGAALAMPALVRAEALMPVRVPVLLRPMYVQSAMFPIASCPVGTRWSTISARYRVDWVVDESGFWVPVGPAVPNTTGQIAGELVRQPDGRIVPVKGTIARTWRTGQYEAEVWDGMTDGPVDRSEAWEGERDRERLRVMAEARDPNFVWSAMQDRHAVERQEIERIRERRAWRALADAKPEVWRFGGTGG